MIVAKGIMAPAVISVSPDTPLEEAMEIIIENKITGLPVIDDEGFLVGIISEADRLRKALDSSSESELIVSDHMTSGVITVNEDTSLTQITDILMRLGIRRVPVMRNGSVVGIVSRRDLIRVLQDGSGSF